MANKIKIKGTKRLDRNLNQLVRLGEDATDILEESAVAIQEGAQSNIRTKLNKNPTGALEGNVKIRPIADNVVQVGVFDDVYGRVHEFGAIIRPVVAKMLRFEVGGRVVFAKQVQIPQRAWLRPAVQSERKTTARMLAKKLAERLKEIVS